jgi:hypothetical protein
MDHIIENLFSSGDFTDPTVAKLDSDNLMLDAKFPREPFRLGGETKGLQSDPSAVRDIDSSRNFVEIPSTSRTQKEVTNHTESTSDSELTDLESDVESRESSDSETSQLGRMELDTDFPRVVTPLIELKDLEPDSTAVLDIDELSDSVGIALRRRPSRTQRFKRADLSLDRVRADLESNVSDDQSSRLAELEFSVGIRVRRSQSPPPPTGVSRQQVQLPIPPRTAFFHFAVLYLAFHSTWLYSPHLDIFVPDELLYKT